MAGLERLNNLKIADFNHVAKSDEAIKLSSDGTVIAKSSLANKTVSFFKPEKVCRENQQATATFVASITRTITSGTQSELFSKLDGLSQDQKEALVTKLLNYRDASGKGILDDQLKGAKPLPVEKWRKRRALLLVRSKTKFMLIFSRSEQRLNSTIRQGKSEEGCFYQGKITMTPKLMRQHIWRTFAYYRMN